MHAERSVGNPTAVDLSKLDAVALRLAREDGQERLTVGTALSSGSLGGLERLRFEAVFRQHGRQLIVGDQGVESLRRSFGIRLRVDQIASSCRSIVRWRD